MQISDLIAIGKLGKSVNKQGYIPCLIYKDFQQLNLENVFLLFTDDRVRYVTIVDMDSKNCLKIDDEEILLEAALDGNVQVMLAEADIGKTKSDADLLIGRSVRFQAESIGKVADSFFNGAHEVLEIVDQHNKTFMVPVVEAYVEKIEADVIYLKNINGLLDL